MRVEERHYDGGKVEVVVCDDDLHEVARLEVDWAGALKAHDEYNVAMSVKKRGRGGLRVKETAIVVRSPFRPQVRHGR